MIFFWGGWWGWGTDGNICALIRLQGPLEPQRLCAGCGGTLEWSKEHRCESSRETTNRPLSPRVALKQFIYDN